MIDEGTEHHDAVEIARRVERFGAQLGSGCDWDAAAVSLEILSRHIDDGLEVFTEVVTEAAFPDEAVERLRRQRLAEIERRLRDPSSLAALAFARAVFGGTPYGSSLLGTRRSIESLERDELLAFYRSIVASDRGAVLALGDLDAEALQRRLDASLGQLPITEAPLPPPSAAERRIERRVIIVDRPEAAQTELRVGHPGCARRDPDRPERLVLNTLLGGKFTSRINLNLRERHGYTYGASSRFVERLAPGPFVVATAVANDVAGAATREILGELERLRAEPPEAEEVDSAVSYLLGVFPYTLQTLSGLADRLEVLQVHRLPPDEFEIEAREMAAVTPQAVHEASRSLLHPERAQVVVVGPAAELRPQLEELGPIETVDASRVAGLDD
jgi:zinc protease